MPNNHPGLAHRRMYPVGRRTQTTVWGRQAVTANTPFALTPAIHGLKVIEAVFVQQEGATPGASGYEISGTTVNIESAATGTVSRLIFGY